MNTALAAQLPRVLHIGSRRFLRPMLGADASFDARLEALSQELVAQLLELPSDPGGKAPLHFVCSTILSKLVGACPQRSRALFELLEQRVGLRPSGLLQGYQCAGWGFALRFAARYMGSRRLVLSIADSDLHDMMAEGYEAAIAGIGFGVTTVCLELSATTELPQCDGPFPHHGFIELMHSVRSQHKKHGALPTFMPFLPEGLAGVAQRMLGASLAPNRHHHYGHTFGSDPWIGLAEWLQRERLAAPREVLLAAFAYDGYYTAGRMSVGPFSRVSLRADLPTEDGGRQAVGGRAA